MKKFAPFVFCWLVLSGQACASQNNLVFSTSTLSGYDFVTGVNGSNDTLASNFSGSSTPSSPVAYQTWAKTATGSPTSFSYYDGASWVQFGTLNTSTHAWNSLVSGALVVTGVATFNNKIGLSTSSPAVSIDASTNTDAVALPVGTSAQRPTPAPGMVRYNSTFQAIEAYLNNMWVSLSTGTDSVNVKYPPYSAACDGATNDTTAFTSALASGKSVLVPRSSSGCVVGDVLLPSGADIRGYSPTTYNGSAGAVILKSATSATSVLDVDGSDSVAVTGLFIDGRGFADNCISGGSNNMTIRDVSATGCAHGLGGQGAAYGDGYTRTARIHNFNVSNMTDYGAGNLVDSFWFGGYVNSNVTGIYSGPGANDNLFDIGKIEFNTGAGIDNYGGSNNIYNAGVIDRNYAAGVRIVSSSYGLSKNVKVNSVIRRNGKNGTAGQRSHVYIEGDAQGISLDLVSDYGGDDGTGLNPSPLYVIETASGYGGSPSNVAVQPGNYNGFTGTGGKPFYNLGIVQNLTLPPGLDINGYPGHVTVVGSAPSVGSGSSDCGTSPAISGNDSVGSIVVGSATNGAKCTVTFNRAWPSVPKCVANNNTSASRTVSAIVSGTSTMAITSGSTLSSGDVLTYNCAN